MRIKRHIWKVKARRRYQVPESTWRELAFMALSEKNSIGSLMQELENDRDSEYEIMEATWMGEAETTVE